MVMSVQRFACIAGWLGEAHMGEGFNVRDHQTRSHTHEAQLSSDDTEPIASDDCHTHTDSPVEACLPVVAELSSRQDQSCVQSE